LNNLKQLQVEGTIASTTSTTIMHIKSLALAALTVLTTAIPTTKHHTHHPHLQAYTEVETTEVASTTLSPRNETFNLVVINRCKWTKQFALYEITSDFQMLQRSTPVNIPTNGQRVIKAPYRATGMRLSGHAEWGTAGQWQPQALFEFGYSEYMGMEGSAYNLSVMEGSDEDVGVRVWPIGNGKGSGKCQRKTCWPTNCPPDQGWRNPNQVDLGSPADTVCYKGKTAFRVVFCPIP
jgi:hypothetical protein